MPHAGSKMGLTASGPAQNQQRTAQGQQAIANQIYKSTTGLRSGVLDQLGAMLNGDSSPSFQAAYMPARESLEGQFQNVQNQIRGSLPRGGQLNNALLQSDIARAGSIGNLDASLRQQAFGEALNTGFQAPGLAIAGYGAAGNQFGNIGVIQQHQAEYGMDQLSQAMRGIGQASSGKKGAPGAGGGSK